MTLPEKRYARFGRVLTFDKRGAVDQDALVGEADVHTGEVEVVGEWVRGIAVHIGARGSALASANEVLVSSTVRDLVAGSGLLTDIAQRCTRPDHSGRGPNGPGFSSACI